MAPDTPGFLSNLTLHIMSDTYIGTDQKVEMSVDVCKKDFGPTARKERQIGPDKNLYMKKLLSLMSPDGDAMAVARLAETVKKRNALKRVAVRKALAAEHGDPDSGKDDEDPSKDKMGKSKKANAQFNAWNKLAVITRLGCRGLERYIPDSLATDDWVDWKYCDPQRNYIVIKN